MTKIIQVYDLDHLINRFLHFDPLSLESDLKPQMKPKATKFSYLPGGYTEKTKGTKAIPHRIPYLPVGNQTEKALRTTESIPPGP